MGLFGNLFDFNGDGHTSGFEELVGFHAMQEQMKRNQTAESEIDLDELDLMDEDEKREYLEDLGLDANDFDF